LYASEGFREPAVDHKANTAEPMRLFCRESALNHSADWSCHKYSRMKRAVARWISLYVVIGQWAVDYKARSGCPLIGAALTAQLPPYLLRRASSMPASWFRFGAFSSFQPVSTQPARLQRNCTAPPGGLLFWQ
jgi:hypothetical protein